ncbi:DNA-binding PucR family transcriptional regulator [Saccharothrix tamanrassetensis]|uniref:DNA-binding PucR family transcriptional regulator n=1 Tax=Saccharothrix tamanrassetensis TaxID=1051531 RepID=A0A841CMV8_9PSEU|nr:helix-turn-helix domain-containing protein [Saccharothrix tamanrassetensis]MBB5958639.1 DNA-binding PucR family transcriptional regulator [Saccharothrix tamanrassetensis]
MSTRPRAGLGRVLEDLGTTLLDLAYGDPDGVDHIDGVVIHDPLDEPVLPPRALVLGVGIEGVPAISGALRRLGGSTAAALVVRSPVPVSEELAASVRESGVALLGLTRGASWAQLAALLRSLLADGDVGADGSEAVGGPASGDLFALANAVAALLDAPVTIEDRSSRVLAFSGRQEEADPSRVETILGRQVPDRYTRSMEEMGVFRELYRGDRPVYVDPLAAGLDDLVMPRVAIAVRAGDEVLGSIWAAVRAPLNPERTRAFQDAAKLVALHMMRLRAGADVQRRLRADLVGQALEAGPAAAEAVRRLGLVGRTAVVLAMSPADPSDPSVDEHTRLVGEQKRVSDAFAMHLGAVYPRSAVALLGDVAYAIVPVPDVADAIRVACDFVERVGVRVRARIGVGCVALDVAGLRRSRTAADRALRVLRSGAGARRVAQLADVEVEVLLLELRDLMAAQGDPPAGPIARLAAYDATHGGNLVQTLRAWLDAFGDVAAASAAMYVHQNTFRYRLRRLSEVGGLDLTDPDARFAAMLHLRLMPG